MKIRSARTKILIASLFIFSLSIQPAFAVSTKELERVMVIGSQENQHNITGSAQYLNLKEQKYNYNDVNRALRQVVGVHIQEEEGFGNRPNIGLRGGSSERSAGITLMEDGILAAPAPYSAPSAYYFPRINRMSAVEVRKGSSTIKFGPRTTSGAVNLISSQIPAKSQGKALLGYGQNNTQRAEINYGNTHGNFGYVIDISHEATDGFKKIEKVGGDSGFSIQDVMAKFRFSSDPLADIYQHIEFKLGATGEDSDETYLGLTQEDFENNPFNRYAASQKDNMDADHRQFHIRHYIELSENWDVTTTAYRNNFRRNWYKLDKVDNTSISSIVEDPTTNSSKLSIMKGVATGDLLVKANDRKYYSQGIQTNIGHKMEIAKTKHDIELGLRYHYDEEERLQHRDTYSMATNGVMSFSAAGAVGSAGDRTVSAQAIAIFLEDEISLGKLKLTPGVRYENIDLRRRDTSSRVTNVYNGEVEAFVPALGVGYEYNKNLNLFASIHQGFSAPTPSKNTSPAEEESVNYEIGAKYNSDLQLEAIAFFNDYDNLLGADTAAGGGTGTGDQYNGGAVNAYGFELGAKYDLAKLISGDNGLKYPVALAYTFTNAEFRSSFESNLDQWGTVTKGDKLTYLPEHQLYLSLGIESKKWLVSAAAKYISEMRTEAGSGSISYGSGVEDYIIVDVTGEYEIAKSATLFATVYNIFDKEYMVSRLPAGARPATPLSFISGLKFKF